MDDKVTDEELAQVAGGSGLFRHTMLRAIAKELRTYRRQAQEAPRGYDLENQKAENLGSWRLPLEAQEAPKAEDLQEVIDDYRRLTRELDIALNGDGAAKQASLCDIVAQVKREKEAPKVTSVQSAKELAVLVHDKFYFGREDESVEAIEADRTDQRQAGREERQHEVDIAELEADRVKIEWEHDLERYAELAEVLKEARYVIGRVAMKEPVAVQLTMDHIDNALEALDEGRKG